MIRSFFLAPLAIAAVSAATLVERQSSSSCACGYKDSTGAVWREAIVSDFTAAAGAEAVLSQNFKKFDYPESHKGAPYNMSYNPNNVYAYNYGLGLKTSAYPGSGLVQTAGISTIRDDIKYGSFRMRATVPSVPGVCFGFFTYKHDEVPPQEADVEFLTSDQDFYQRVYHTNHPGTVNGDTDPEASKSIVIPGADFTAFHEHRLDWLPTSTKYYYDSALKSTVAKNSPTKDSSLIANVWSDGEPLWSRGPPQNDAIATIYYIKVRYLLIYDASEVLSVTETNGYNLRPFKVHVPDEEIERTKTLLRMRRLPDEPIHPGITADDGTQHDWMHEAKSRLLEFDWRAVENKLNSFSQYLVDIEGATVLEYHKVIEPLVNAPDGQQSFDVIIPSLPGVGYSTLLPKPGATVVDNARIFDTLMTRVLGYETYVGQGGDFGAVNLRQLQTNYSSTLKLALFQSFFAPRPDDAIEDGLLPAPEQTMLEHIAEFTKSGMGYFLIQSSRVSTIGLTMYDNPQAYLAWLGYKYIKTLEWAKLPEEAHQSFMDEMHSLILLQQYTGTIHTSMAMYQYSGFQYGIEEWKKNPPNQAPFGVQHFEGEFYLAPQSWIKNHGPMIWHQYHKNGGHFAPLGAPEEFVDDCRQFFGKNYWKQLELVSTRV
ncbi:unnamed protein product [Rhizoctonia solani]|uniref:GH16 domain-containing protein n=1 Tax=Rhizoctonia solani TaxID=456999 RepID=A0A8H2WEL6_9AGAM|nr:unnamed protein product [Rhizoctonia solani]